MEEGTSDPISMYCYLTLTDHCELKIVMVSCTVTIVQRVTKKGYMFGSLLERRKRLGRLT
jgi:hypothetical protein